MGPARFHCATLLQPVFFFCISGVPMGEVQCPRVMSTGGISTRGGGGGGKNREERNAKVRGHPHRGRPAKLAGESNPASPRV